MAQNGIDTYVQVATDGSGKKMRNLLRYEQQADGTTVPVYEEVIQVADGIGNTVDFPSIYAALAEELRQLRGLLAPEMGDVNGEIGNPVKRIQQGWSISGLPSKAEAYQPTNIVTDRFGRQITLPVATRDMMVTQGTTISASTSETTVLSLQPGMYLDLVMLIISNTSASTNTRIDVRDKTGGSVLFSLQSVGGAAPVGFALPVPIPQTTAGNNWTVQCGTSTTDIRVYAVAVKNQ